MRACRRVSLEAAERARSRARLSRCLEACSPSSGECHLPSTMAAKIGFFVRGWSCQLVVTLVQVGVGVGKLGMRVVSRDHGLASVVASVVEPHVQGLCALASLGRSKDHPVSQ